MKNGTSMIERHLTNLIISHLKPGFVNVIYGPRRVGKTILLSQILERLPDDPHVAFNGDTSEARDLLGSASEVRIRSAITPYPVVIIDEAQRIENIGISLKIMIDLFPEKKIFVTGSSSLDLARGLKEALTGRTQKYRLYPLSTAELTNLLPPFQKPSLLPEQLIYGGYPYLAELGDPKEKQRYLQSLADDYLFRDVLELQTVARPDLLAKLVRMLAYQIGSEVSHTELAAALSVDVKTVQRYLMLLKSGFIITELGAYSTNLRKEINKGKKYYFWDLGIRNALIEQFVPLDVRQDTGALWENFLVIERIKKHEYAGSMTRSYFWRSYQQAEIDWVEREDNVLSAYEFKWGQKNRTYKTPKTFYDAYQVEATLVTPENYLEFVGG